jgi:outer membrane protein OmpA-like peptidoglycan-associated protein
MRALEPLLLTLVLAGCGRSTPPELVQARSAYEQLARGPASRYAPEDVQSAKDTLAVAERSFDRNGASQETRDIAYVAERQARIAESRARTVAAIQRRHKALIEAQEIREGQARATEAQVAEAQKAAEQARAQAEERAIQAAADLAGIATVKREARGLVITLPASALFAGRRTILLPAAEPKLGKVADVLANEPPDAWIRVQGYTDAQGSTIANQEMSQRRAVAVRDYLVAHGIPADRVTAEGLGPAKPIAEDTTPEGRLSNRRIEIVVETPQR